MNTESKSENIFRWTSLAVTLLMLVFVAVLMRTTRAALLDAMVELDIELPLLTKLAVTPAMSAGIFALLVVTVVKEFALKNRMHAIVVNVFIANTAILLLACYVMGAFMSFLTVFMGMRGS